MTLGTFCSADGINYAAAHNWSIGDIGGVGFKQLVHASMCFLRAYLLNEIFTGRLLDSLKGIICFKKNNNRIL